MKTNPATIFGSLTIFSAIVAGMVMPVWSADHIVVPYDWTIDLQSRELKNQFEYSASRLRGVEKIQASYKHVPTAADPEPDSHPYEHLWYHDGKPIGLERKDDFDVNRGDGISIVVDHKDGSASDRECTATANAILRVILDCYLNKNAVVNVRIPDSSFDRIKQSLMDQGCVETPPTPDETGHDAAINIFLQTEPHADRSHTLYYL
jgi:hypothetical protein